VSFQHLVAACSIAVLLLAVAGINSLRNRNGNGTPSSASAARNNYDQQAGGVPSDAAGSGALPQAPGDALAKAEPLHRPAHVGKGLDCSTIPGGHLITGQWDRYTLSDGRAGYLYEFLCVGSNGQRSASEVQMFEQVADKLEYRSTVLPADVDQHLLYMTTGAGSVRIQTSVHHPPLGGVSGEVISMAWELSANAADGSGATVAEPCLTVRHPSGYFAPGSRESLPATVTAVPDAAAPAWRLSLRNASDAACAIEGFPQVRAQRGGTTLATAVPTMNGPAGGVSKQPVPPIIVLPPGFTASAIIEQSASAALDSCQLSDELAVTLPNGVSLGELPAQLSGCGLVVHPLVGNARGSD
jgi:hypothetical protein